RKPEGLAQPVAQAERPAATDYGRPSILNAGMVQDQYWQCLDDYCAFTVLTTGRGRFASGSSFLNRWNSVATSGPDILCQTLKIALGTAASGEKWALANAAPRPEFCMPISIDSVLRWAGDRPVSLPSQYPTSSPRPLCSTT